MPTPSEQPSKFKEEYESIHGEGSFMKDIRELIAIGKELRPFLEKNGLLEEKRHMEKKLIKMSKNTQSTEDNADLLEAYFQAALTEGNAENIHEFLKIAAQTQDDASFKARLRFSNIELYNAAIKPTIAAQQLSINEKVNNFTEVLDSTRFKTNMQRIFICEALAKKYPSVLKRFRDESTVICVSLSEDVNKWVWKQIKKGLFKDRAETVEYALTQYVKKSK